MPLNPTLQLQLFGLLQFPLIQGLSHIAKIDAHREKFFIKHELSRKCKSKFEIIVKISIILLREMFNIFRGAS